MSHERLSQFAYHSTLADGQSASCVGTIIKVARAFNALHGITGVLLFDGERFCQYVEGAPSTLDALVQRIRTDLRHNQFTPLLHGPLAGGRRYPQWSMAYSDASQDALIDLMIDGAPQDALVLLKEREWMLDIG